MTDIRRRRRNVRILKVKLASLLFGLGSWITITGFWVELPLLIQSLPEKWALSSQLTLFIQAANLGPFLYWICRCFSLGNEVAATHIQMVIGFISCIVLIFFWNTTIYCFNADRSVPLMMAAFGLAILDCTSSVTFLPFMARLKTRHLTPYLIGEGLSGFIPIIAGIIQGSNESDADCPPSANLTELATRDDAEPEEFSYNIETPEYLFGPSLFFTSLLATLMISWIAFFYLNYARAAREEYLPHNGVSYNLTEMKELNRERKPPSNGNNTNINNNNNNNSNNSSKRITSIVSETNESSSSERPIDNEAATAAIASASVPAIRRASAFQRRFSVVPEPSNMSDSKYRILQIILLYACVTTFGIFPSLQPYSNLPYGNWALHYTVILTGLAYPAGCFITLFKEITSVKWITIWTLIATAISIHILRAAIMSPLPPFVYAVGQSSYEILGIDSRNLGGMIMVTCWTLYILILSYVKTIVTILVSREKGEEALFMVGLLTQIASLLGAGFMFLAVNYYKWFSDQCQLMLTSSIIL